MARPKKQTVDYFPHSCVHKKTMFIIEQKYGNDGYAFWFKLLEILGSTEGHCLSFKNGMDWEFLIAKTQLDKEKCNEILDLLAVLGAIDKDLWEERRVWSDNFIENIKDAYRNRIEDIPCKPSLLRKKTMSKEVSDVRNPHTKLKETKLKNTKKDNMMAKQIISYLNKKADKNFKPNSKVTINKIKARINDGYSLEDFKKVIDIKTTKWKSDSKMYDYLRPETLFGNKFESYLNEKPNKENWRTT